MATVEPPGAVPLTSGALSSANESGSVSVSVGAATGPGVVVTVRRAPKAGAPG